MTTPYAIPNYKGQAQIAALGADIDTDGMVIPCWHIRFHDGLSFDSLYSAASSPRPDTFPGFSEPGLLEFWGPWRSDFNPYSATPTFVTGQTVQCQFSIYAGTLDGLFPQALVALIDTDTEVESGQNTPSWHMILVGNWQFNGYGYDGTTYAREAGDDNNADTTGF